MVGLVEVFINLQNISYSEGQITDMAGKTVSIPAEINKTYSTAGSVTILLYMLFPDTMIGWNFQNGANNYIPDKYKALPILGG